MKKLNQPLAALILLLGLLAFTNASAQSAFNCSSFTETFDGESTCGTICGNPCTLTNGWLNASDDTQDWTVWTGATGSLNTGPSGDHTSGSGNYIYLETSSPCFGSDDTAHVESPIVDATGFSNFYMGFWRHLYGSTMGNLHIDGRTVVGGVPGPWTLNVVPPYTGNLDQWLGDTIDLSAYAGGQFQIRFRGTSSTNFYGDMALDDISFFPLASLDLAAVAVNSPTGAVSPGPNPVSVSIRNLGVNTITSATINWEVNGQLQPAVPYSGSLVSGATDGPLPLGSFNFPSGNSTIKVWTSSPNGSADLQACNDTIESFVCTSYSGNFLVGAGQFFTSPEDAAQKLATCGVSGNVVLDILPGTYQGRVILPPIPGAGPNATITFNGGDTSLVTIEAGSFSTIFLDGADYITFKNVTIRNTANLDAWGVMLQDTAEYNTIDSCRIQVFYTTNADVSCIVASSTETSSFGQGLNARYNTFSNNSLEGGYYGVRFTGSTTYYSPLNRFENNIFSDQIFYCIYSQYQDSLEIVGNTLLPTINVGGDGIYLFDQQNFIIEGNDVSNANDYGIYIADGNFDFPAARRGRVVNNFVSSQTDRAFYVDDFNDTDIWHNTFVGTYGMYVNDMLGVDIRNNIVVGTSLYAVYSLDNFSLYTNSFWDYNLYYADPAATGLAYSGGATYTDLPGWQAAFPSDNISSLEGDPVFTSGIQDLHVRGPLANDAGDNAVNVLLDIDGEARPQAPSTIVDIGADEFTPLANDAVFLELISPKGFLCGDSVTDVVISIQNLGATSITNMPITIDVSGDINAQLNFTYTGPLGFAEIDTVNVGSINTYNGGVATFNGYVSLAGDQLPNNDSLNPSPSVEFIPFEPQGVAGYGCGTDSAVISGRPIPGVSYNFFATPTDTVVLGTDSYTIPSISTQNTYYMQYGGLVDSLFTTNAAGNGSGGNIFDLVALQEVKITGFAMALDAGTHNCVVYYRPSPFAGFENSPAGWILLDSVSGIPSSGPVPATRITNNFSVTIPAGQTYSFCVFSYNGNEYSNGSTVGSVFAQNPYFQFLEGVGKGTIPFNSSSFSPRVFNGEIYYEGEPCSQVRTPVSAVVGQGITLNIGPDTTTCGTPVGLDAGNPGASFAWSNGDLTQTTTATMTAAYSVLVTDTNGCTASDTANIVIAPNPTVDLGPDTTICKQDNVILDAGNPGGTYAWSNGNVNQIISAGPGNYSVMVTDVNGCMGADTVDIIGIGPDPDLGADTTLCDGAALSLDAGPGVSYAWSTAATSQSINVSAAGSYSVNVLDSAGCIGSDTVVVATETSPTAAYTFAVSGAGLVYDFTYTGTTNANTYAWDFGDGSPVDNNQDPSHTYAMSGNYTVALIITNDCGSDTITQSVTVVTVENGLDPASVDVYPNPSNGQFMVAFAGYDFSDVQVEVYTIQGQRIHSQVFEQVNGAVKEQIQLQEVSAGMYIVRFTSENQVVNRRITVE